MKKIVIIPCGGAKLTTPAPARELYIGSMFRDQLATALTMTEEENIFILSAKHGLIALDTIVEPYDLKMGQKNTVATETLAAQVDAIMPKNETYIIDYKTGSAKYPDTKQLKLMALMTFAHFPEVERIKAGLLFVMHNTFVIEEYSREGIDELWECFAPDLMRLDIAYQRNSWSPKAGPLCGWCPVSSCNFYKER